MLQAKLNIEEKINVEKNWLQISAILIVSLVNISCGICVSWPSPAILKIVNDHEHYNITELEASYFVIIPPISMLVSSYLFSTLCQKIGPKKTMLLVFLPHSISWILVATAKSVYVFYIARILTGMGDACLFVTVPLYVGEIATPKVRGSWGGILAPFSNFGVLIINVVGYYLSIPQAAIFSMIFPVIHVILFSLMPESPYFLIRKEKMEEAKKSLQRLRRKTNVDEELESLKFDVNRQLSETGTWKELITIRSNRKSLYAGIFLRVFQQLSGINCFVGYAQLIFEKSGTQLPPHICSILFMGILTVVTMFGPFFLDRLGRKLCFKISSYACAILLLMESIYFYIDQYYVEIDLSFISSLPLIGLILYCVSFSIGFALVPTLMLGELFSSSIKTKALHLMNIVFGLSTSTISQIFYLLQKQSGLFGPFLMFSVCCFISGIGTEYFVPETKGKTLEQIQQNWKSKKTKDKNNTI